MGSRFIYFCSVCPVQSMLRRCKELCPHLNILKDSDIQVTVGFCLARKHKYRLEQDSYGRCGRRGGLMVSALDSVASGPGSSPGRGYCVVFLGKKILLVASCYGNRDKLRPGGPHWPVCRLYLPTKYTMLYQSCSSL